MSAMPPLLRAMRPHQWTKNLFVFAPIFFAQDFGHEGRLLRVVATFAIFCLLASSVYLVNDIKDRDADRLHPRKCKRPIAAGELGIGPAIAAAVVFVVGGLAWAWFGLASKLVVGVLLSYLGIQVLYTWKLKHVAILDVLCIASGFVLRLVAGATAAWVLQSKWILICTIFVSLFLALAKRRHEVVSLGEDAAAHRKILADYPPALLDQLISVATAATLVSYTLYALDEKTATHGIAHEGRYLPLFALTVPFVIYGLFRYLYLVYRKEEGGTPTTTLLTDRPSLINAALYALTVSAILYFGGRGTL